MNVKEYFIRAISLTIIICCTPCNAQSLNPSQIDKHSHRKHIGYEGWERIIPTHTKIQFAGGMGILSAGAGWDYGKQKRWETDILLGYLPKKYADESHITLSLRQNYIPWLLILNNRFNFEPFTCGIYMNFISGEKFWIQQPARYPGQRYYAFTSRLRTHIYVGQRITYNILSNSSLQGITLYYELSANDLNIVSKFGNKRMKLSDIVYFSAGVKFQILSQKRIIAHKKQLF